MRTIILSLNPFLGETWALSAIDIFERTGGNTGNLAFQYAVSQHIAGQVQILPLGTAPEVLRERGDIIVIPLANQLGFHTNLGAQAHTLEKAQLPVIGIGLGAQAVDQSQDIQLTEGTDRWLRTLASLAPTKEPNIGVRGEYTRQQIEKLGIQGAAIVTGCPSNFIASETGFVERIAEKIARVPSRVAVTAGIPFIPKLSSVEQDLADLVTVTNGVYIVQHGIDMIRLACDEFSNMKEDSFKIHHDYIAPHLSANAFMDWCRHHARAYSDVRAWMADLRHFDFVVGTRFHGAMFAIQAGTPAGVIAHDSRTLEMCQTMGIPVLRDTEIQGGITRRMLRDLFPFDANQYSLKRRELSSKYIAMLEGAGLSVTDRLKKAAKSANLEVAC
jgi:hypothetical protein